MLLWYLWIGGVLFLIVAAVLFLLITWAQAYSSHTDEARACLVILRNKDKWGPYTDPYNVYCLLIEHINWCHISTNELLKSYAPAARIGSTPEELFEIHRQVHIWKARNMLRKFRMGIQGVRMSEIMQTVQNGFVVLDDIGTTPDELAELDRMPI